MNDDALAPIPFTARQIHDAMPVGLEIRWALVVDGQERTNVWRVRGQSDDALTLESGPPGGPFQSATTPWTELRQHAAFPAADTTVKPGVAIDSPLSEAPLSTVRYVVQRPPETHTFWFSPEHPGPPVQNTIERDGAVTFRMQQVSRTRVDPATWPEIAAEAPSP